MKKIFVLILALALASCGAPATEQPAAAPPQPSATPVVVVQTVVVSVVPTEAPPTEVPPTPIPPTPVPPTEVPPTQPPAPTAAAVSTTASGGPIPLDNALGKGVFINMTMSGDSFSLRCFPRDITFNVTSNNVDITDVELYYRIVDQPKALYPSEWRNSGKMERLGNGNFSVVFSGEDVHPDLRLDLAWFEFQFVGLNKGGGRVDASQKLEKLVTYRIDCP